MAKRPPTIRNADDHLKVAPAPPDDLRPAGRALWEMTSRSLVKAGRPDLRRPRRSADHVSAVEYAVFSHVGESAADSLNKLEKVFFKYPERGFLHKFARTIVQLFQQLIRLLLTGRR